MKEIKIQFELKESGDILFKNLTDDKTFTIDFLTKKMSAKLLYDALAYSKESIYVFDEDQVHSGEKRKLEIFVEVKDVIVDICCSINKINSPQKDKQSDLEIQIELADI